MNRHIRNKMTWELVLTAHHVYILYKSEKLGAFTKLRKATISFAMSVCPSAWNWAETGQSSDIWVLFRKSVEKSQVSFKSDKNNRYLHEDVCTFIIISHSALLRTRDISDKVVDKITRILCPITFSHKSCSLCDNVEKHGTAGQATDDNITRCMPFRVG